MIITPLFVLLHYYYYYNYHHHSYYEYHYQLVIGDVSGRRRGM